MKSRRHMMIALALAAGIAAAPASADVAGGVTAWQAGDYAGAVRQWRPLAEKGDADAQFNMGQAYRLGRGVPADLKLAQSWFEKAAAQGHEKAQANLGLVLFETGNRPGAMPWIKKAADRGDARAQYLLGTALFNGDLLAKDWPRAYALMTRAAAQGLPQAATSLSELDKYIPLEQRQRGIILARQMEGTQTIAMASASPAIAKVSAAAPAPQVTAAATPAPAPAAKVAVPAMKTAAPTPALKPVAVAAKAPGPAAKAPVMAAKAPEPASKAAAKAAPVASVASASVAPATGGRWRVQLGAFPSPQAARSEWAVISKRISGLSGFEPSYEPYKQFTRLRVGPLAAKADANRLCGAAKAAGRACFVVAP